MRITEKVLRSKLAAVCRFYKLNTDPKKGRFVGLEVGGNGRENYYRIVIKDSEDYGISGFLGEMGRTARELDAYLSGLLHARDLYQNPTFNKPIDPESEYRSIVVINGEEVVWDFLDSGNVKIEEVPRAWDHERTCAFLLGIDPAEEPATDADLIP